MKGYHVKRWGRTVIYRCRESHPSQEWPSRVFLPTWSFDRYKYKTGSPIYVTCPETRIKHWTIHYVGLHSTHIGWTIMFSQSLAGWTPLWQHFSGTVDPLVCTQIKFHSVYSFRLLSTFRVPVLDRLEMCRQPVYPFHSILDSWIYKSQLFPAWTLWTDNDPSLRARSDSITNPIGGIDGSNRNG